MRSLAWAFLAAFAACYDPHLMPCSVTCGNDSPCPDGLSCGNDGFCHASGDTQQCDATNTTLTVASLGNGGKISSTPSGVSCTGTTGTGCMVMFAVGTQVTLDAHPFGDQFVSWSGDECDGQTSTPCQFTITAPTMINGVFQ